MLAPVVKYVLILALLLASTVPVPALAQGGDKAQGDDKARAAAHFEQGVKLYQQGKFADAIKAYSAAHQLAPHPDALFNIARCHENLGKFSLALQHYQQALALSTDPKSRADLQRRIQQLRTRPVKVFVTSQPSGAQVTVDGQAAPARGKTPLVVLLKPGEHVLLYRKDGFMLAAGRVVVKLGQEQTVEQPLSALPRACPPAPAPCPKPKACPKIQLTDPDNLHLQLSALAGFGITEDRHFSGGPGVQVYFTYKRLIVGTHFLYVPVGEGSTDRTQKNLKDEIVHYTEIQQQWMLVQVEAGYVFPFDFFYLYATGGLGLSTERLVYRGVEQEPVDSSDLTKGYKDKLDPKDHKPIERSDLSQETAFAWSVGGGIEAFALPWLSFGTALRFGVIHGDRAIKDNPNDSESGSYPYGVVWGTITFHL